MTGEPFFATFMGTVPCECAVCSPLLTHLDGKGYRMFFLWKSLLGSFQEICHSGSLMKDLDHFPMPENACMGSICSVAVAATFIPCDVRNTTNSPIVGRGISVMEEEGMLSDHTAGIAGTDGEWHHIAVTWQSSDGLATLYDNGRKVRYLVAGRRARV